MTQVAHLQTTEVAHLQMTDDLVAGDTVPVVDDELEPYASQVRLSTGPGHRSTAGWDWVHRRTTDWDWYTWV